MKNGRGKEKKERKKGYFSFSHTFFSLSHLLIFLLLFLSFYLSFSFTLTITLAQDIKVKEQSIENLLRGRKVYEPPRFMTVRQCCEQLMEVEAKHGQNVCGPSTRAFGLARVGASDQLILSGTLQSLCEVDFGAPLHAVVIVGATDHIEEEMIAFYAQEHRVGSGEGSSGGDSRSGVGDGDMKKEGAKDEEWVLCMVVCV